METSVQPIEHATSILKERLYLIYSVNYLFFYKQRVLGLFVQARIKKYFNNPALCRLGYNTIREIQRIATFRYFRALIFIDLHSQSTLHIVQFRITPLQFL